MIDKYFADMFIDKIGEYMDDKFMVFNTQGIIIAATEPERVGTFHEASFNMMKNNQDMIIVRDDEVNKYLGVKPGIDMTIRHENEILGGVGVTGPVEQSMPLITMAKLIIEVMLDYELYKEANQQKLSKIDLLGKLLLDYSKESEEKLLPIAQNLNLKTYIPRVCILFKDVNEADSSQQIYRIISNYHKIEAQDILFINKSKEVVLFKTLPFVKKDIFTEYRAYLLAFINPLRETFLRNSLPVFDYFGSMQTHMEYYKYSYKHCQWLEYMHNVRGFFYDHINEYIEYLIPATELNGIYDSIAGLMTPSMKQNFEELFSSLKRNNYNLVQASNELHMHKNTLVFRLDKYRDLFMMNPMQYSSDRDFFDSFISYFKKVKKGSKN